MAAPQNLSDCCQPAVSADARVLILGETNTIAAIHWPKADQSIPLAPLEGRYELAVLIDPDTLNDQLSGDHYLALARDQWAKQVLSLQTLPIDEHTSDQRYFALGYRRRQLTTQLKSKYIAYGFCINHYKTTPDWLNSKYWANPERWHKN